MKDPAINNGAVLDSEIDQIDWEEEFQPLNHPVKHRIGQDKRELYNIDTGQLICRLEEGYKWYWFHSHIHIKPANYDKTALEQDAIRLEGHARMPAKSPTTWLAQAQGALVKAEGLVSAEDRPAIVQIRQKVAAQLVRLKGPSTLAQQLIDKVQGVIGK